MGCVTCPNCGTDLGIFDKFQLGHLVVWGNVGVYWKDRRVRLNPAQRLLTIALARAKGALIPTYVLAEIIGYDGDQPREIVAVIASRVRTAFREVDPYFCAIEADGEARFARGLRWVANAYIIPELRRVTPKQRALHKLMLEHPGASIMELQALHGSKHHSTTYYKLKALERHRLVRREKVYQRGWVAVGTLAMHAALDGAH